MAKGRAFRIFLRLSSVPLLILLLALTYLSLVGIPRRWAQRIERAVEENGFSVRWDRVRLVVFRGLIAENLRIFTQEDELTPLLEARRVTLRFDPILWLQRRLGLHGLRVYEGRFRLATSGSLETAARDDVLEFEDVRADLRFEPGGIVVEQVRAAIFGVRVEGRGFILTPEYPDRTRKRPDISRPLEKLARVLPEWSSRLVQELNASEFEQPPRAEVTFTADMRDPKASQARLVLAGDRSRLHGVRVDGWGAQLTLTDRGLGLDRLYVKDGEDALEASAVLELESRQLHGRVESSLRANVLTSFLPTPQREKWMRAGVNLRGALYLKLELEPGPMEKAFARLRGSARIGEADVRAVLARDVVFDFERRDTSVLCTNLAAVVGRGPAMGPLSGWLRAELGTLDFEGAMNAGFDPNVLTPVVGVNVQKIIRTMSFPDRPPRIAVHFGGQVGSGDSFSWEGDLFATNFFYNGVFVSSVSVPGAKLRRSVLKFDPIHVLREDGEISGRMVNDFSNRTVDMDFTGVADPKAVARIIGPNAEYLARLYRVEKPCRMEVRGLVDYRTNALTDLHVRFEGEKVGVKWLLADTCRFDLHALGRSITVTNLAGSIYGGEFAGYARFDGVGVSSNLSYTATAAVTNLAFSELVTELRQEEAPEYRGRLTAHASLRGMVGEGMGGTVLGEGEVRVVNGRLFKMRLLGGLSDMLGRIWPGLGSVQQTSLQSTFTVRNRKVITKDLVMDGRILQLKAEGAYSFNEDLEFNVWVQPTGEGAVSQLLQFVTKPLSLLLEFHLDGTLQEPKWRPQKLPKELFFITK